MTERDVHARLRVEEIQDESAMRDAERRMAREERRMEQEIRQLEEDEVAAEQEVAQEWRHEHWGRGPERPPAWDAADHRRGKAP